MLYNEVIEAFYKKDIDKFFNKTNNFLILMDDMEKILNTNKNYLLGINNLLKNFPFFFKKKRNLDK